MLTDAGRSLAEIAMAAGFSDQSHFTRCFRRQFGITPAAYRQAAIRSKT
jgi:transcriptional regulator GlxA family with amidase domain